MQLELKDELKELVAHIRKNISYNMCIYVDATQNIVIERELETCETMFSIMNIMEELKNIQLNYMPDFTSTFEMWTFRGNPVIYCTYERNKIN